MPTIIFDFDSTLVSIESLDEILALNVDSETAKQISAITDQGMNGELSFRDSLQKRLEIAKPTQQQIDDFAQTAIDSITPGMRELIDELQKDCGIYIVSGGLKRLLDRVGQSLGIPTDQIHGVSAHWDADGNFISLDNNNPFCTNKIEGVRVLAKHWDSPTLCVGDGMTDYALFQANLVDHFIAFTQHQKRDFVDRLHLESVENVDELSAAINHFLRR